MIAPSKKLLSLFLIFSLMMLSVNLYAKERRGAKLIITKTDGRNIRGELITVKENSLLILDTEGKDVSVGIVDIKVVRIVKKSKFLQSLGIGLLIGAAGGALLGYSGGHDALYLGIGFGFIGLLIGGISYASTGKDEKIKIERMTDSEIQETLYKLRKKARIRDYK